MTIWGTWDIETKKNCDCQDFKCRHVPIIDKWSCKLNNGEFYQGEKRKELINLFLSFTSKKSNRYLLYAHNGNSYDIFFIINSFIKLTTKEERSKFQPKRSNQWQEIRWRNIRFLDSYLFFKKSLDEMMNQEEQEKKQLVSFNGLGERKYNWEIANKHQLKNEEQILNEYNKNDTITLYRILENIWQEYPDAKGKTTIAGLSFYLWKKENPQQIKKLNNLAKPWADDLRKFCERGYFAALEDDFNESIWEEIFYKYDVNSFYPFLMKVYAFPLGRPRFVKKVRQEFNPKHEIGFMEVEFENLQIKEGWEPFLPLEDKGVKVNFRYFKTYRAVLPTPLLELALEAYSYTSFRILRKCLFLNKEYGYFKDFVEKYSQKKETSERDSLEYVMAKNILNNLYGKFGQRVFRQNWKLKPVKRKLSFLPTYWDKNGNPWQFRREEKAQRSNGFNYVPIAAFTTAYARVFMARIIKEKGNKNFFYCGKDSLVSKIPFSSHEIDPVKTGYWKSEGEAKEWISHSAKAYQFGDKKIMKGLKKNEAQRLDFRKLQTQPARIRTQTSFKTNQGVIITQKEKIFQPAISNHKRDLIDGAWVARDFNYGWEYWNNSSFIS